MTHMIDALLIALPTYEWWAFYDSILDAVAMSTDDAATMAIIATGFHKPKISVAECQC